jgi:putative serine protease PepD
MSDESHPSDVGSPGGPHHEPAAPDPVGVPYDAPVEPTPGIEAALAAETAAVAEGESAPAATGPMIDPPPMATWADPPAAENPVPEPVTAEPTVTPARQKSGVGAAIVAAILVAFVIGAFAGLAGGLLGARLALKSTGQPNSITVVPASTDEPVVAAAAAAVPSVVNIDTTQKTAKGGSSGLPSTHPNVPLSSSGSGVAFKSTNEGGTYILTNNHVVENATTITVKSPNGQSWPGTVVGRDPDNDIAVVKIDGKLPLIKLGSSKTLIVGQTVVAIGSPFGLEHSVTAGVVSALGRALSDTNASGASNPLVDVIQTDAAINPGNSGGALVDRLGQLVGINTAIYTESGSGSGVGFAVQVDTAVRVAAQLIDGGKVAHPFIGIVGVSITPQLASSEKLPVQEGALAEEIVKDSGAYKAGLKKGDIVTAVDGTNVSGMNDLILLIRRHSVGESATLTVLRDGKTMQFKVVIADRPAGLGTSVPSTETTTP